MSWLTIAQQEESDAQSQLGRDIFNRLNNSSRFYIRSYYYRLPAPMAGSGWQIFKCDIRDHAVIETSPFYANRNNAVKWIAKNIHHAFYDGSDVDNDLLTQWEMHRKVVIEGWNYTFIDVDGTFRISVAPANFDLVRDYHDQKRKSVSTRVHHHDASILEFVAFSRYADLVTFVTSKTFAGLMGTDALGGNPEQAITGLGRQHPWSGGNGADVPAIINIVRELADRHNLPAGFIFTGKTVQRNEAIDLSPYEDLTTGNEEDDVYLSFRNGLLPKPEDLEKFRTALDRIVTTYYPTRRVDLIDDQTGPLFAVRRSDPVMARQPKTRKRPRIPYTPRPTDEKSNQTFDAMMSESDEEVFSINMVGLKKEAQNYTVNQGDLADYVSSMLSIGEDSIFCIDKLQFKIGMIANGQWLAYKKDMSEGGTGRISLISTAGPKTSVAVAAGRAAQNYAHIQGYDHAELQGASAGIMTELDEHNRFRTNGHDIFIVDNVPIPNSTLTAYALERVPLTNRRTPRENMVQCVQGNADILSNYRFTREIDAKLYLAMNFDFNDWESERITIVPSDLRINAAIDALREVSVPTGTKVVGQRGWNAMSSEQKYELCVSQARVDLLDFRFRSPTDIIALIYGWASMASPEVKEEVSNEIRRMGYDTQYFPDMNLMLIDTTLGSSAVHPENRPQVQPESPAPNANSPDIPVPTQDQDKPKHYITDRERFDSLELPQDDDDFGMVFSSVRMAGRKPIVVSFDYDSTLVFPDAAPDGGGIEYDEFGEPVSSLNPVAAEIMRLHASRGDKIVIVTCRTPESKGSMWEMVHDNGLPVSEIYCTSHSSKAPTLRSIGASVHYDDSLFRSDEIRQALGNAVKVYHPDEMEKNIALWGGK